MPLSLAPYESVLRLLAAIALNTGVLLAAYRFAARRVGGDIVQRALDTFLLYYLLQYAVVGLLGIAGVLAPRDDRMSHCWLARCSGRSPGRDDPPPPMSHHFRCAID